MDDQHLSDGCSRPTGQSWNKTVQLAIELDILDDLTPIGFKSGPEVVELDARSCTVGFEALDDVKDMHSAVRRLATFAVEDGAPGVKAA